MHAEHRMTMYHEHMNSSDRFLRNILAVQGAFYLSVNIWALIRTQHFLQYNNPDGSLFETRGFAALSLVVSLYFLAGAWRVELQRPAAFLGLGSALAIGLVELFHLPEVGWSLLWADLFVEIVIAALYVNLLFFRREPAAPEAVPSETSPKTTPLIPEETDTSDTGIPNDDESMDTTPDSPDNSTSPNEEDDPRQTEKALL